MIGKLIPAGTGMKRYSGIEVDYGEYADYVIGKAEQEEEDGSDLQRQPANRHLIGEDLDQQESQQRLTAGQQGQFPDDVPRPHQTQMNDGGELDLTEQQRSVARQDKDLHHPRSPGPHPPMPSEKGIDDKVQQDKVANLDHPLEDIIRIIVSPHDSIPFASAKIQLFPESTTNSWIKLWLLYKFVSSSESTTNSWKINGQLMKIRV